MVSITIRNVPDETRDELASKAAAAGQSLQEYLRTRLISFATRPDMAAMLQRIEERNRNAGSFLTAEEIIEARDADRR